MVNRESDTSIRRDENGNVIFTNQQTQTFSQEDFVEVFNDNVQNYENLLNQLEQFQEQRQQIIEESRDELAAINYVLGNDTPYEETFEELEGEIDEDSFQQHQQLEQLKEQIDNLESQQERLEEQLAEMQPVAEDIAESVDDVEIEDIDI